MINFKKIALIGALAAEEKKAEDIVILNLQPLSVLTDYFVILSCESQVQIKTVANAITDKLSQKGIKANHIEGTPESKWILLDYNGVIIHIFHKELRNYYQLEKVWGDAKNINYKRNT
ncbi:ribosome silencing factor [bacterium]|nr:ribosome silencing factor [bacterium]